MLRATRWCVPALILSFVMLAAAACSSEAPPEAGAIRNRDSLPVMTTYGCSKLISDSGVVRYKIIAERWDVYDKTNPPRQEFPKGILLLRYDDHFIPDLQITADTAYWYDQNLWELRGRVFIEDDKGQSTFTTERLYYDQHRGEFYSNCHVLITKPDQQLSASDFTANDQWTRYTFHQARGYMPMPEEKSTGGPATNKPTAASTDPTGTTMGPAPTATAPAGNAGNGTANGATKPAGGAAKPAGGAAKPAGQTTHKNDTTTTK